MESSKTTLHCFLLLFLFTINVSAQQVIISGYLLDAKTKDAVAAPIYLNKKDNSITANTTGYFSFSWPKDKNVIVEPSSTSHEKLFVEINAKSDTLIYLYLTPILLQEVVTNLKRNASAGSIIRPDLKKLKSIPPLLGEADILKTFTLYPGIASGNEGTTGLFVRGGTPDQNLLLLDNAVIFNPSHLLGFISTFNQDAIQSVDIYKGNFPSRYGGRLSAVVDVKTKTGMTSDKSGHLAIGPLSSKFNIQDKLYNGRWSYSVAARSTYLTLLLLPVNYLYNTQAVDNKFNYWMQDINLKSAFKVNENSFVSLSVYNSGDYFNATNRGDADINNALNINWGNFIMSLQYISALENGWIFSNDITLSRYKYNLNTSLGNKTEDSTTLRSDFEISNYAIKHNMSKQLFDNVNFSAGIDFNYYRFLPKQYGGLANIDNEIIASGLFEASPYVDLSLQLNPKLIANAGYRHSFYNSKTHFFNFSEPRVSINIKPNNNLDIIFGYSRMVQPLHLLNSSSGLPNDVWIPASKQVPPATSGLISAGFSQEVKQLNSTITAEIYAKRLNNLVDYPFGFSFFGTASGRIENLLATNGKGISYGVETFYELNLPKVVFWLSHTWSKTEYKFDEINSGRAYPSNFDRRHDISLSSFFLLNKKWKLSAVWTFQTGRPFTAPVAIIPGPEGRLVGVFGDRNNARLPLYHRLDIGFEYAYLKKKRKRKISFGLINAYNRVNPFYYRLGLSIQSDNDNFSNVSYSGNGFLPILPYFSYEINLFKMK